MGLTCFVPAWGCRLRCPHCHTHRTLQPWGVSSCPWEAGFSIFLREKPRPPFPQVSKSLYFLPQPYQYNQGKENWVSWERVPSPSLWGKDRQVAGCPHLCTSVHAASAPVSWFRPQLPGSPSAWVATTKSRWFK